MLNKERTNVGYRLGRLLAVAEHAQRRVIHNINRTIVDSYYGSASSTPAIAFPRILKLTQHHMHKSRIGNWYRKIIGEILNDMPQNAFPCRLKPEDQGQFALGYFHQREHFFQKKENPEPETDIQEN